jgi:hypothetical protein
MSIKEQLRDFTVAVDLGATRRVYLCHHVSFALRRAKRLQRIACSYGFCCAGGVGEATGLALPAGRTPAPESGAGDELGDGCAAAGVGEVAPAVCCFINSRRNALLPALWRAYKIDNANVSAKKMPASQAVNFTSTFVVCAPKIFSVTPPPNAAPKPSLFGRCIKITSIISNATSIHMARRMLIKIDIGTPNIAKPTREANVQRSTSNAEVEC